MTKVFYIGDDAHKNEEDTFAIPETITKAWLDEKVRTLDVSADVEHRKNESIIKVMDHMGSSQYLANGVVDTLWLRNLTKKSERHGNVMWYFVKRDD